MDIPERESIVGTYKLSNSTLAFVATFVGAASGSDQEALANKLAKVAFNPGNESASQDMESVSVELTGRELGMIGGILQSAWDEVVAPLEKVDPGQFALIRPIFRQAQEELGTRMEINDEAS